MKRVLSIAWYFLSCHWAVLIFTGFGAVLLAVGLVVGLLDGVWGLAAFGAGVFFLPMLWSGQIFRELVSNRRLTLVPHFRTAAVAAQLLAAVAGSAATVLIAAAQVESPSIASSLDAALWGFVLVSAVLLLQQWFCTFRGGILLQLVVLAGIVRLATSDELPQWFELAEPAPLALAAGLGWLWLAFRQSVAVAGPTPAQRIENWGGDAGATGLWGLSWLPSLAIGGPGRPGGTLMRGAKDNLASRIAAALVCVLGFGALFVLWYLLLGHFERAAALSPAQTTAGIVMMVSWLTLSLGAPLAISEWPLRLRYLWLRSPGSRLALWRRLDRAVLNELVLIAAITGIVGLLAVRFAAIAPALALAYVAGSAAGMAFSSYLSFTLRLDGTGPMAIGFLLTVILAPVSWIVIGLYESRPLALLAIVALFAGLAAFSRRSACAKLLEADWCAARPARTRKRETLREES